LTYPVTAAESCGFASFPGKPSQDLPTESLTRLKRSDTDTESLSTTIKVAPC